MSLVQQSSVNLVQHAGALEWRSRLNVPHGVGWLADWQHYATMHAALKSLFASDEFPSEVDETQLRYERDTLGKPFVTWSDRLAQWADAHARNVEHLHVSNTHDGGAHVVLAAYHPDLAGVGIDAVHLPRLEQAQKDETYLRRFAGRFMSAQERMAFEQASAGDDLAALRLRTAAHFSLMEAASKACGTGLKIGGGMGRETSLPKQSLGALQVMPEVELLFEGEAQTRLTQMNVTQAEAHWNADETFLISVVLLWR